MAEDLGMDLGVVKAQLAILATMLDVVDAQTGPMRTLRARQHQAWSEIDACKSFAVKYAKTLAGMAYDLKNVRDGINDTMVSLRDSAKALADQDESIRNDFATFMKRLEQGESAPAARTVAATPTSTAQGAKPAYNGGTKLT